MPLAFQKPRVPPGEPLQYTSPTFELSRYSVCCLPARAEDGTVQNWTLKQLDDERFRDRLKDVLPPEARTYYAPTVSSMSGVVLPHTMFTIAYELDGSRQVRRPGYDKKHARLPCDGTFIQPGDGFLMSAGGCPVVVLSGTDLCLVAHAGRDSLIDRHLIRTGRKSRAYFSVIEAMVAYAKKHYQVDPKRLILRSFFSLPTSAFPHDVRHPHYGSFNHALYWALKDRNLDGAIIHVAGMQYLSLNTLIQYQAERLGVGHVDSGIFTLPVDGDFAYTRNESPEVSGNVRNLVALWRH